MVSSFILISKYTYLVLTAMLLNVFNNELIWSIILIQILATKTISYLDGILYMDRLISATIVYMAVFYAT